MLPNIGQLVEEGLSLDRHYTYPVCTPSRKAFLSGRYPVATLRTDWGHLPLRMSLVSDRLKDGGYTNHMIGKCACAMPHLRIPPP